MTLPMLLARIEHEWTTRKRIFDLPTARFWKPDPDIDLSFEFLGRPAASPVGPAAGPHSQMAQNIVLSWLGGCPPVRAEDGPDPRRPRDRPPVHRHADHRLQHRVEPGAARPREPRGVRQGVDDHRDAQAAGSRCASSSAPDDGGPAHTCSTCRSATTSPASSPTRSPASSMRCTMRPTRSSGCVPRSPTTRCSPSSATSTSRRTSPTRSRCRRSTAARPTRSRRSRSTSIDRHDIDVIVKLNPTLLGPDGVSAIVHDTLGYGYVELVPKAFDDDLPFDRAITLIDELHRFALDHGHRFGIKLTNTLVVHNHKGWMPDETMYLSGAPLHVLATAVLDRARDGTSRSVHDPRPRRADATRRHRTRRRHHGQLLGRGDQGEPRRHDRDGRTAGERVLRPAQARWLRTTRADAQGTDEGRRRRRRHRPRRLPSGTAWPRRAPPAIATRAAAHLAHITGDDLAQLPPRGPREAAAQRRPRPADVGVRRVQLLRDRVPERRVLQGADTRRARRRGSTTPGVSSTSCSASCATSAGTASPSAPRTATRR